MSDEEHIPITREELLAFCDLPPDLFERLAELMPPLLEAIRKLAGELGITEERQ